MNDHGGDDHLPGAMYTFEGQMRSIGDATRALKTRPWMKWVVFGCAAILLAAAIGALS